jgi:predicted RNA-binding protein with PIN domain
MSRDRGRRPRAGESAGDRGPAEETEPGRFRWIVDGHNAIFGVPAWESLQVSGQRGAARRHLEESLEEFGRAAGVQVWVVYDGNDLERNPDAIDRPHLRSEYSWPPENADERIAFLAARSLRAGERPVIVTSDRRTLAASLPPGARVMPVPRFFGGVRRRILHRPEKWMEGAGLEDVERHFLERSPYPEDRAAAAESAEADRPADPEAGSGSGPADSRSASGPA